MRTFFAINKGFAKICAEPYRLFFPLGLLALVLGVSLWILPVLSLGGYPVKAHGRLMFNGFIAFFIGGFLMTALPRFSQTRSARFWEVALFLLAGLTGFIFEPFFVLQPIVLTFFLLSRVKHKKRKPPAVFIFVGAGLALWSVGAIGWVAFPETAIFRRLARDAAPMLALLGVSARIIPGIQERAPILPPKEGEKISFLLLLSLALFIASYFLDEVLAGWLRFAVAGFFSINYWNIFSVPPLNTRLSFALWGAGWALVAAFLYQALSGIGVVHEVHGIFINGFVMLALLIGTRVVQSHSLNLKELEDKKPLYWIFLLTFSSSLTRVAAPYAGALYFELLAVASILLLLSTGLWCAKYLKLVWVFPIMKEAEAAASAGDSD